MSEAPSRLSAPRGRSSGRGGRGSYSSRGGRGGSRQTNGDRTELAPSTTYEDEGEIGQLKKQYASQLITVKEMFPDWTDEDIVFALQETDGDLESTIEQITEGTWIAVALIEFDIENWGERLTYSVSSGNISQWGEVKKKTKDRSRSKVKDTTAPFAEIPSGTSRGGRGRGGAEGVRGGRGRGAERGRGGGRGGRGGSLVNGSRGAIADKHFPELAGTTTSAETTTWDSSAPNITAVESSWDQPAETTTAAADNSWENVIAPEPTQAKAPEEHRTSLKPDGTRSWASIFNKPPPAPAQQKVSQPPPILELQAEPPTQVEPVPVQYDEPGLPPPIPVEERPKTPPMPIASTSEPAVDITPSKDELTETNLEQVLDTSAPPATATAASTVASTQDLRSAAATPLHASQQQSAPRPPMGGFATSAYKATAGPVRSASFQRRVMEQQEAVVMPSNHAVDRAAVQFGSMGLNGAAEDLDVDDDREEAETRAQPPQHSPNAPRAALPPAPQQQAFPAEQPLNDSLPTPRQTPGLPPAAQQPGQLLPTEQAAPQPTTQGNHPYNQFNSRYGAQPTQPETSAPVQKAYEPFGQQAQQPQAQQHQYDGYATQTQAQSQPNQQAHSQIGAFSSAPSDYTYYTTDSQRTSYPSYYGNFAQQGQQSQQEAGASQPRVGSAFSSSVGDQPSQYATSQAQQPQARLGQGTDAQTSGHSTPNPALPAQHQPNPPQPSHQMQQQPQGQAGGQGAYPYGQPYYPYNYYNMNQVSHHSYGRERPMFDDVRRYEEPYLTHSQQFGYGSQAYGGPFGGKQQGMYGQPHQGYGMSPQSSYEHSSSPANVGGFGQHSVPGRDGAASGAYGRTGSAQASEGQQNSASGGAFGGVPDVFGRSQPSYSSQGQTLVQQHSGQQSGNEDSMRSYGESKGPGGPSPALGQPGRPGSATNNIPGQTGLPPPQAQSQQGYGGYPNHMSHQMHGQQGSQYSTGLGGLGGHHQTGSQNHQGSGYGSYGATGFGGSYYGNTNRGGWGGNYGH